MTTAEAPKVLMIAYACNPEGTGEHWLGWGWAEQAAKKHRVYLLTSSNARDAVERHAQRHGIHARFIAVPKFLRLLTDCFGRFGAWARKMIWAYQAVRLAEAWHRQEQFAIVHQTTFHTFRVPFLATRMGIPSVWGPVAGGEYIPFGFYNFIGPLYLPESIRRVFNWLWFAWPPVQRSLERVNVIFVSNHTTMRFLGPKVAAKCIVVPPNAMRLEDERTAAQFPNRTDEIFRLLYVGNCLPTRAMGLAFAALARSKMQNWEFSIIGTGLGLDLWHKEARAYGVASHVKFLGQLPHAQLAPHYENANVLVFPALRDSGGSALLEAMSKGLPVICLDWAGPSEMLDADSGIKVPVTTPQETVHAFADALSRLQKDPALRARLGRNAAERTRRLFTWDVKRELLERTYAQLLSAR